MGAVFTLGLLLFLAIGGILLLFFVWLPLFIIGIVRGKKGKRRWPFFLACGIVFFFALPMILPFPILVTVTTTIYNENNPVIGEKIKRKRKLGVFGPLFSMVSSSSQGGRRG